MGECVEPVADIAVIGLAVMGMNLILNMDDHGYTVCAFNRTVSKVHEFVRESKAQGRRIVGANDLAEMVAKLKRPRRVMLLVKAGAPVDAMIKDLTPLLQAGDIIIDGGNSLYSDTERRYKELQVAGIHYVGCGVSGGEEGARFGPSMMPGGSAEAWPALKEMFQAICAKTKDGRPCCDWVGDGGAGHFVKMVHNGIEYGDMQLICEAYQTMRDSLLMDADQMAAVFEQWNGGVLDSFLMEITAAILKKRNEKGQPVVELIRDAAGQKGTGKWTVEASLELGSPMTLVGEAVFARALSSIKDERERASSTLGSPLNAAVKRSLTMEYLESALYAAKIVSYTQGFMLFRRAAKQYNWELNYGAIATMWMGGCIIRSAFLGDIDAAFRRNSDLECLFLDSFFQAAMQRCDGALRETVSYAISAGVPVPGLSSALAFWDGYRTSRLPANLLQAQRDYFGAHTFEYLDAPGQYVHLNWTGTGGSTSSTHYDA